MFPTCLASWAPQEGTSEAWLKAGHSVRILKSTERKTYVYIAWCFNAWAMPVLWLNQQRQIKQLTQQMLISGSIYLTPGAPTPELI